MVGLRARLVGVVAVAATATTVFLTQDPWDSATRVLWADRDKAQLASGEHRDFRFRSSPQDKDWSQWVPSRRDGELTSEERARAISQGFAPEDVCVAEVLLTAPGCSDIEAATLEPSHAHGASGDDLSHQHDSNEPPAYALGRSHRHQSGWSNTRTFGDCIVPAPTILRAPEPERVALLASGLALLALLDLLRRRHE